MRPSSYAYARNEGRHHFGIRGAACLGICTDPYPAGQQDATEIIYSRAQPGKIGFTKTIDAGRYKAGQPNVLTLWGLKHSSLAVTLTGIPLCLTAVKFWTRKKYRNTRERSRSSGTSISAGAQVVLGGIRKCWPWVKHLFGRQRLYRLKLMDKVAHLDSPSS